MSLNSASLLILRVILIPQHVTLPKCTELLPFDIVTLICSVKKARDEKVVQEKMKTKLQFYVFIFAREAHLAMIKIPGIRFD